MGFLSPKAPTPPPVPPPAPTPGIEGVDKGKIKQEKTRLARRKGVKDTILTGSGLTQEAGAASTYKPTLLK
jgi:hypothetical protein|tara:strand:+ start:217 stop:429 length:213 start_codon:yes stop_codon:yes gene_type:complete